MRQEAEIHADEDDKRRQVAELITGRTTCSIAMKLPYGITLD
jgi:hypothetical protein